MDVIGELVFVAVIIMIWSVLYKENPFYKFVSSMSVGLMLAFWLKGGIDAIIDDVLKPAVLQGSIPRIVALLLGLAIFLRFSKSLYFASKWPIAILAGVGTAIASKGAISAMVLSQLKVGTFVGSNIVTNINNVLIFVGVISTLVYFLFSFGRGPVIGRISRIGQIFMMAAFGVVFGQYVYGSSVMAQMIYLLKYPGYYITAITIVILVVDVIRGGLKSEGTKKSESTE